MVIKNTDEITTSDVSSFRTVLVGSLVGLQAAAAGSLLIILALAAIFAFARGIPGIEEIIESDPVYGVPRFTIIVGFLLLPALGFSAPLGVLGGVALAFICRRNSSKSKFTPLHARRLGAIIGGFIGIILAILLVTILVYYDSFPVHNLPPDPLSVSLPRAILESAPILIVATLMGRWAGKQLGEQFVAHKPAP
jgi:uncharacterized BrkB/YihY/UPF0761 family membrane protein